MTSQVRLFALPYGYKPTEAPVEQPGFAVDSNGSDDDIRARVRARLVEWGYLVRAVNVLAGTKPHVYVATVVSPKVTP